MPPETTPPTSRRPGAGWWAGAAVVALALCVGGYLLGYDNGQSSERDKYQAGEPAYQAIYDAGLQQGVKQGAAEGAQTGEEAGRAEGEKAGFEEGQQAGEVKGTAAGANAALGGFTDWDTAAHYIVRMASGPSNEVPFSVSTRTEMQEGSDYALCQSDPARVCVK